MGLSRRVAAAVVAVLAGPLVGCGGAGAAQQPSIVPEDQAVILERADRARVKGDSSAPIRMLEVSDFQCPFCARFNAETLPALDSLYIRTGRVQYVWFSFPNPGHPLAWPAIEAAFCAGAVGKFWPMHDLIFAGRDEWGGSTDPMSHFVSYALSLDIDEASYAACLREDRPAPLQVRDYELALRAGISSTPFFVLGDEVALRGALPLENFRRTIDSLLVARGGADP
ncbi:MAG: DsbA family protein [Gemmatimonadota bacterium]